MQAPSINVNQQNVDGETALTIAQKKGHADVARVILEHMRNTENAAVSLQNNESIQNKSTQAESPNQNNMLLFSNSAPQSSASNAAKSSTPENTNSENANIIKVNNKPLGGN